MNKRKDKDVMLGNKSITAGEIRKRMIEEARKEYEQAKKKAKGNEYPMVDDEMIIDEGDEVIVRKFEEEARRLGVSPQALMSWCLVELKKKETM